LSKRREENIVVSVLVIGNYRASLTVMRSLAGDGYNVIAGVGMDASFTNLSRSCREVWEHPPIDSNGPFVDSLLKFLRERPDILFIFPVVQSAVVCIAELKDRLPANITAVISDPGIIKKCLHKSYMLGLAETNGIPVEPYAVASDEKSLFDATDKIGYPCIVRPIGSETEEMLCGKKAFIALGQQQIEQRLIPWPVSHDELLLQRFSPGPRHGIYFAAQDGQVLALVEVVSERTDRSDGTGFAIEGISVAPSKVLIKYLGTLVSALNYTGIGCVQFLRRTNGSFHFLELNPRLGGNSAIAVRCGLDLPVLACELASAQQASIESEDWSYPVGITYAWTFGAIQGLRRERNEEEMPLLTYLRGWVRAVASAITADIHLTWSVRDPLPAVANFMYWEPFGLGRRLLARYDRARSAAEA
jgi:predicted ATP-grasp superfamily ATP-dependent carboligase